MQNTFYFAINDRNAKRLIGKVPGAAHAYAHAYARAYPRSYECAYARFVRAYARAYRFYARAKARYARAYVKYTRAYAWYAYARTCIRMRSCVRVAQYARKVSEISIVIMIENSIETLLFIVFVSQKLELWS